MNQSMQNFPPQQAVAQQAARITPPGWYPDPVTGSGERYWDGIEWSREFTRSGPQQHAMPQQHAIAPQPQLVQYPVASNQQSGLTKGIVPMVIASVLFIWRVMYLTTYWEARGEGSLTGTDSYNQGALLGSVAGFFLTGLLFTWGMKRYRSASASPTGEPADVSFGEAAPMAIAIAVAGAGLSYFLGTQ